MIVKLQMVLHFNVKQKQLTRLHNRSPMNTEALQPVLKNIEIKTTVVVT